MILHAIGDSHCRLFWDLTDRGRVHWLGPMLMHRVARDGLRGLRAAREWLGVRGETSDRDWVATIEPGATVAWCFGEIDVRCHLAERVAEGGGSILLSLTGEFLAVVEEFSSKTKTRPAILSVTPATESRNAEYPCRGALSDRRAITALLNDALRVRCPDFGAVFADVFAEVSTPDGGIRRGLTQDGLHLGPAAAPIAQCAIEMAFGGLHVA